MVLIATHIFIPMCAKCVVPIHYGYPQGTLKKDAFGIANAVGAAALAGTHLYLGFKKDGENKKKEDKPKKDDKKDDKKK